MIYPSEQSIFNDPTPGAHVIQWTKGPHKNQHLYFTSLSVTADDRWLTFISDRTGSPNLFAIDRRDGSIRQLSNNDNGVLHSYVYPLGGTRGLSKASPVLDPVLNRLYYVRDDAVYVVALNESTTTERKICDLPAGWYGAFNHVSPDGKLLCIPCTDPRAFVDEVPHQWEQMRKVPGRMKEGGLVTRVLLINAMTGELRSSVEVPFWVTHVQFDPAGTGRIIFNQEGFLEHTGTQVPNRIWCLETDGKFRPLAAESLGEWRSHENWSPDGKSIVYHGGRDGKPFVAARAWDGTLIREASMEGIATHHATSHLDGRRMFLDRHDGVIALVDPESVENKMIDLCRHDTSMSEQDVHAHPITTPDGRGVIFTSDRGGNCNAYELRLPQTLR